MGYEISLLTFMGISIIGSLSLNLITGFCGQVSLGHVAFVGMGAYTASILTKADTPFFVALLAGMLLAGSFGVMVGLASLRVRHDFLAITTMGVNFVFLGVVREQEWLGGELGVSSIPDPGLGKLGFLALVLGCVILVALLSLQIRRSWMGYVFEAVSGDEDTARMLGLDVSRYKLIAFALGTALAGLSGGLYAHHVRFIFPDSFAFVESITLLAMVVIGGNGSILGVIVASALLSVLPQWFQFIGDYKLLLYGSLLFVVMRFSPGGLAGLAKYIFPKSKKSFGLKENR
ncbi:MAG: branched-chain amino acid ABC transporter permease [Deltaproteobacteria bacterium]|jgi:branched-chain amino acid transport system permease protein|nr:branched-chain amino acid ABC transporter permease [Deltaproteobacteria bacterium]MBT4068787.1 branched-chain amino acid ABC transporter permease [Candidatus Neomarinimicrobiota bacterium]